MTPPPALQFSPVPSTLPDLVNDHDHQDENDNTMSDFNDLFDFDGFASDSHSLTTVSPNRTPSPFRTSFSPFIARSTSPFKTNNAYASGSGSGPGSGSRSTTDEVKVKEEPMDWQDYGFDFGPTTNELGLGSAPIDMPSFPTSTVPVLTPTQQAAVQPEMNFSGLPKDQQDALQQLMINIYQYQNNFGTELPGSNAVPIAQPTTIEPSLVFSTSPTNTFATSASASNTGSYTTTTPAQLPTIPENVDPSANSIEVDDEEEEPLRSVELHEMTASNPSRVRQSSTFSSTSDISSKLDRLAPREAIFSAGKGKGGKKGGGLSSVVRGDDEDLDDDDSWRPSPEEYKKLSSKEKRQLRNKLSARAFRTRRKDYIGTLEGHIKDRDDVIDEMRSELMQHRNENRDLRKELEALKAHTMKILHPEPATTSAPQGLLNTLAVAPLPSPALVTKSIPAKRSAPVSSPAPTPKFNPRKDLPSSSTEASRGFWGQDNLFGGGSTICHHTFVPPPSFKQSNINPLLNSEAVSAAPAASSKDLSMPFHEWSADNQFNLRSMDSYRMQIWSRLTREAQAEKDKVPLELRPKFYVENKPTPSPASSSASTSASSAEASLAAHLANAATNHITTKLATSFWSAFTGVNTSIDTDKLTAVVTGQAKLSVVPNSSISTYNEKGGVLDEEGLSQLMGGLKLQAGTGVKFGGVRENPLGVFSNFIKSAGCH